MTQQAITIYTTAWCGDCQVAKRFLTKFDIPYQEVDIENDPAAAEVVMRLNDGRRSVPTLVYGGDAANLSGFSRAKLDAFLQKHELLPS